MVKFKVTPDTYLGKDGKTHDTVKIFACGDTVIGHLEIPIRSVFPSDSKLLPLLIADCAEE